MRKLLPLILLTVFFIACSSDDDNTDPNKGNNGNENNSGMIDKNILGKWKVEYSKTISPAQFDEKNSEVSYASNASIIEYFGNWGEPNVVPKSGLFDQKEIRIKIQNDNTIIVSIGGGNPKTISYKIEDGYLKWQPSTWNTSKPTGVIKYRLESNKLIMELVKAEGVLLTYYTISRYSKITE